MIEQLKRLDIEVEIDTDELILAKGLLRMVDEGYQEAGVDTPTWVTDKLKNVSEEINRKNRAELEALLKKAQARRMALRTADEKRKALEAQISELEAKLTK